MAEFTELSAADAPKPVRPQINVARIAEYDSYVNRIAPGEVGVLKPTGDETPRMLTHRVSWAGKRAGLNLKSWVVDGIVYFELLTGEVKAKKSKKVVAEKELVPA